MSRTAKDELSTALMAAKGNAADRQAEHASAKHGIDRHTFGEKS
jgi:hypothetical protein